MHTARRPCIAFCCRASPAHVCELAGTRLPPPCRTAFCAMSLKSGSERGACCSTACILSRRPRLGRPRLRRPRCVTRCVAFHVYVSVWYISSVSIYLYIHVYLRLCVYTDVCASVQAAGLDRFGTSMVTTFPAQPKSATDAGERPTPTFAQLTRPPAILHWHGHRPVGLGRRDGPASPFPIWKHFGDAPQIM